jgi:chromate transporter
VVIVVDALRKIAGRALTGLDRWVIAGLSFVAIFALGLPFPLIIAAAAAYGALTAAGAAGTAPPQTRAGTARTVGIWLFLWWAPIAALWAAGADRLVEIGLFFSKLAVVTFGGAYAVLAYMTQEVVQERGWLTTAQMIDGLGLAETTPGPLILVTEFVGFLAGHAAGGPGPALAAAALTLWVTFVPCFLWIFAGAPFIEWVSTRPRLSGALSAITAAVVGVILNLSLWFALNVFFAETRPRAFGPAELLLPIPTSLDPVALGLALLAGLALLWRRWSLPAVLAVSAAAGLATTMI